MKKKSTIVALTDGEFYSLQDAEDAIEVDKATLWKLVKSNGFVINTLFNKYTVLSKNQVSILADLVRGKSC